MVLYGSFFVSVVCCVCVCGVESCAWFAASSLCEIVFACFVRRYVFVCSSYDVSCGVV